jgi:hypothetical protein
VGTFEAYQSNRAGWSGGPFKPFFGLSGAVLGVKGPTLVAKNTTRMGHPPGFVERQNWTIRTNMRRYTRLSNGFSRKLANHAAATALNYFAYNFIKIHRTLRTSPAMAAGVTDRLWSVEDLVALWEAYEQRRAERAA